MFHLSDHLPSSSNIETTYQDYIIKINLAGVYIVIILGFQIVKNDIYFRLFEQTL